MKIKQKLLIGQVKCKVIEKTKNCLLREIFNILITSFLSRSGVKCTSTEKKTKSKVNITLNECKQMLKEVKVQVWLLSGLFLLENKLIRYLDITQGCDYFGKLKYDDLVAMAVMKQFDFNGNRKKEVFPWNILKVNSNLKMISPDIVQGRNGFYICYCRVYREKAVVKCFHIISHESLRLSNYSLYGLRVVDSIMEDHPCSIVDLLKLHSCTVGVLLHCRPTNCVVSKKIWHFNRRCFVDFCQVITVAYGVVFAKFLGIWSFRVVIDKEKDSSALELIRYDLLIDKLLVGTDKLEFEAFCHIHIVKFEQNLFGS
ncbi:hypothetical protein GWI33_019401 [Rhynchophorus ferrugineus]|uniref:Uncharacterized protein n=1 Tax=Rhynchophorus ferrugineus TaxID=354439 RepID=A0A834HTY8_RHYFE|nr:hypothetical protein GWI33_019401 [Rhynchophorus ferrugineus]